MARKIYEGVLTFTPASRTIRFNSEVTHLRQILVIQNLTRGVMLYNFADGALGGTFDENTDTLTLVFDTATHQAGDTLQIFFEPNEADVPAPSTEATIQDLYNQSVYMLDRLEFGLNLQNPGKLLRVFIADGGMTGTLATVTTVATVSTVTNQAQIGGRDAQRQVESIQDIAFNQGILNNISF